MPGTAIKLVRELAGGLESLLFPSVCRACGAELDGSRARLLCPACREELTASLPPGGYRACRLAVTWQPAYARARYDGPAGVAVRLLKFSGKTRMASVLAECVAPLAADLVRTYNLDVAVPVPLHPVRRRERRFNQAEEIGKLAAEAAGVPFRPRGLSRVRNTRPQVGIPGGERAANVRGAFAGRENFGGRRVLLVDDVITTGATAAECAEALRAAGAEAVVALAAAGVDFTEAGSS
jgi:ComF family protein